MAFSNVLNVCVYIALMTPFARHARETFTPRTINRLGNRIFIKSPFTYVFYARYSKKGGSQLGAQALAFVNVGRLLNISVEGGGGGGGGGIVSAVHYRNNHQPVYAISCKRRPAAPAYIIYTVHSYAETKSSRLRCVVQ